MRYQFALAAVVALSGNVVHADLCATGATEIGGNWYCQAVSAITYTGLGGTGSYNKVTDMDSTSGACASESQAYSGSLAPLDEEVSLHFRGPIAIKQFAVYYPAASSSTTSSASATHTGNSLGLKRGKRANPVERRHAHGHAHFHENNKEVRDAQEAEIEKRQLGAMITAVIDGSTVSWANNFDPAAKTSAAAAVVASSAATSVAAVASSAARVASSAAAVASSAAASSAAASTASSASSASVPLASGSWARAGYYNSVQAVSQGLSFLNHLGGGSSGVFDYKFGSSLSYASANGIASAASNTVLSDVIIPSNSEVVIMADTICTETSCGYSRNGTVAHHGFGGAQKLFLFEFQMPFDTTTGGTNADMPAIWMLNAQIPRTLQYGAADCSCWTSGCGEFDLFEVLDAGNTRCKSTVHGNSAGGDSDYFVRPTGKTMKAAVLMINENAHLQVLSDDYSFQNVLTADIVNAIVASTTSQSNSLGISLFALP